MAIQRLAYVAFYLTIILAIVYFLELDYTTAMATIGLIIALDAKAIGKLSVIGINTLYKEMNNDSAIK